MSVSVSVCVGVCVTHSTRRRLKWSARVCVWLARGVVVSGVVELITIFQFSNCCADFGCVGRCVTGNKN